MDDRVAAPMTIADPVTPFGPIHIIEPKSQHTHTAVLLHGRGSNGEEFAEELAASTLSDQRTLMQKLPGWRWVFPSSRELWSTVFQEEIAAWFEAHSLTDVTARQDLQVEGIRESVRNIEGILEGEIAKLEGLAENLVLGGISQGGAIGMWTLLCASKPWRCLGGFVGASTWLPFAINIKKFINKDESTTDGLDAASERSQADTFVEGMMSTSRNPVGHALGSKPLLSTAVFLGHGVDDAYVDVELGRQARDVLGQISIDVKWKEYSGAEQEGHWLKVPEEVDDIANFLLLVSG